MARHKKQKKLAEFIGFELIDKLFFVCEASLYICSRY